jgi:hypothetical protein
MDSNDVRGTAIAVSKCCTSDLKMGIHHDLSLNGKRSRRPATGPPIHAVQADQGAGRIPSFRVGSDWRFQQDLIERWITEGWKESKNVGQLKGVEPALGEIQLAP